MKNIFIPLFLLLGCFDVASPVVNQVIVPLNVKSYGATGDGITNDAPAIQLAINAAKGKPILVSSGTYICNSQLIYNTQSMGVAEGLKMYGDGTYNTTFKNMTNGPLFLITSSTSLTDFQDDVYLSDFAITSTQTAPGGMGIQLHGIRRAVIQNLYILNESSHAIHLASTATDKDNVHIVIQNCDIEGSGGGAIYLDGGGSNVNALVAIRNNRLISNLFGIVLIGQTNATIEGNSIAYNLSTGVYVTNGLSGTGNFSRNIIVSNNEFDTNNYTQVGISGGELVNLTNNYFVANSTVVGSTFSVGVSIQNSYNVLINQSLPRIAAGLSGLTMFRISSDASYTTINDTDWTSWQLSGNTKYVDSGVSTVINDSGASLKPLRQQVYTSVDNIPATYVIPNSTATFQRILIGSTTIVTISTPSYSESGASLELLLWNTNVGNSTVTFVPIFSTATWTNPFPTGKIRTGKFTYDSNSVKWRQIGAWSGDY